MLKYCLDRSNIHKICDKAIDSFLPALKFVPDWFATSQTNKKFIMYYLQLMIYSFFMKILAMSYFLVVQWVFLAGIKITDFQTRDKMLDTIKYLLGILKIRRTLCLVEIM